MDHGLIKIRNWPNAIIHIDGDAFFASCEQSVHPELKGKPVITGQERNIVASMSYEAKRLGITRAIPVWQAKKICPNLIIVPSDYETYSLISKRMFSIMRRFTPMVEESSIDEGFAEINGLRRLYHTNYVEIADRIRTTIEKELDIPVSVGISITKTLAKLASKFKKPRGFTVVPGRRIHEFLKYVPVSDVCGIGPNTTSLLAKRGVHTALDFVNKPQPWIKLTLGKIGDELWRELRGEMVYGLNCEEKSSYDSISKVKTFTPPSEDYNYIKAQLLRNLESALIKLRRYHLKAKRFIIYLKTQEFKGSALEADLNRGTACPLEAAPFVEKMLLEIYRPSTLYRQTGVVLTKLEEDHQMQFELFEDPVRMLKMHRLAQSIDEVNASYGKHTLHMGTGLFLKRGESTRTHQDPRGRGKIAQRKTDLLPGETDRQRLGLPMVNIRI